jgi:hypothetical protein
VRHFHFNQFMRLLPACIALAAAAQPTPKPFQAQSGSSISLSVKNDESTVEISNSAYEVAGPDIPSRPPGELLILRKTTRSKRVLGNIGMEATTSVEAWPMGADLKRKPNYSIALSGTECQTLDNALLVISRGLEETDWWSVHKLANGARLFDTYVPLVRFSISRETETLRYAGLEVPPDDAADARLKESHVVGVLIYASATRVIREAIITADSPRFAAQLRSFADETRQMSLSGREPGTALKLTFSQSYPAAASPVTITIPIVHDDLDLAHAETPARVRIAA